MKRINRQKIVKWTLVIVFAVVSLATFAVPWPELAKAAKPGKTMPGLLVLDDEEKKVSEFAGSKGKTPFDHDQHIAYNSYSPQDGCVVCHHTNSKNLTKAVEEEVQKCTVCHKGAETDCEIEGTNEDKKFKGKKSPSAEDAYHGKNSAGENSVIGCIGCHKERNIEPSGCSTCHNGEDTIKNYKYKKDKAAIKEESPRSQPLSAGILRLTMKSGEIKEFKLNEVKEVHLMP
ncbi:MAG: cytochrome c3 family protein [Acidobacteriota bacterium]